MVGIPEVTLPADKNESTKYATPTTTPTAEVKKPKIKTIRAGMLVEDTIPLIATPARTKGEDLLFHYFFFPNIWDRNRFSICLSDESTHIWILVFNLHYRISNP